MHEYSVTQNIIDTAVRRAAADNRSVTVKKISLVIGEASGVSGESIRLYFDLIAKGTLCEDAVLEIENVRAMLKCRKCGSLFLRKPFSFACTCGGEGEPTDTGREFFIKSIEVEGQ